LNAYNINTHIDAHANRNTHMLHFTTFIGNIILEIFIIPILIDSLFMPLYLHNGVAWEETYADVSLLSLFWTYPISLNQFINFHSFY
jgi:hypothetical protein